MSAIQSTPREPSRVRRSERTEGPGSALEKRARSAANHRIAWYGHAIVYGLSCLLLWVTAGVSAASILALAWGILLATHGFFAVLAPSLREQWTNDALSRGNELPTRHHDDAAKRRERSLEDLSSALAHEIRNPITAAKSLVQQIAEDPAGPDSREHAKIVLEELDRVERSISHLLRFAREEPYAPESIDVALLVRSAIDVLEDRASTEGVRVRSDVEALPPVFGDPEQLRRVLVNLLANALDALAEHQVPNPTVTVSAGQNLAGTETWIRVVDNGPGIPEESREKIFRPFHTTKSKGTGLGLALSRKILDRHGGTIEAPSHKGPGAEFVVVIPRLAASPEKTS